MQTISLQQIDLTGGFWNERQNVNRTVTIPTVYEFCRKTGRIEAMKLNWEPGKENQPHVFWDSDVAKWIEGAAYSLRKHPDAKLQKQVEEIIDLIETAQDKDGYFNSYYQTAEPRHKRLSNLMIDHELYCAGHLIEAAVAYYETTGDDRFLNVMRRYADHIDRVFGPEPEKRQGYCGHEEIELALVKLYNATGEKRYLKLSEYFIRQRGKEPNYFLEEGKKIGGTGPQTWDVSKLSYFQAHAPIEKQDEVVGHAVRALYYFSGAADVARELKDKKLAAHCRRLWEDAVNRKMYVTGSPGSLYTGEAYASAYELPNAEAYAETCATIALAFFSWRMFLIEQESRYIDVMERALYNGMLSGFSLDGKKFFYVNPMACEPGITLSNGVHHVPRSDWFNCSCCPPNVVRTVAEVGQYFYAVEGENLWVNFFNTSIAEVEVNNVKIKLEQKTDYPWDGRVTMSVNPAKALNFTLRVRQPEWCAGASLKINGKNFKAKVEKGYLLMDRQWKAGDTVEYNMPMPVELVYANTQVQEDCGRVAIQRGPLVYSIEEADNGNKIDQFVLEAGTQFESCKIKGLPKYVVGLKAKAKRLVAPADDAPLYTTRRPEYQTTALTAIPYYAWNNRGFGAMEIWIRTR
jgi:DUF1680 family protein